MTDTTAMQRLGHVFGWFGLGFGSLIAVLGVGVILINSWSYFFPVTDRTGYEFTYKGKNYTAVGLGQKEDAKYAVAKHIDNSVLGPAGKWEVFSDAEKTGSRLFEFTLAEARVSAIKKARIRRSALDKIISATLYGILLGGVIILLGLALRYIFAGPTR